MSESDLPDLLQRARALEFEAARSERERTTSAATVVFGSRGYDKNWDSIIDEHVAAFTRVTEEEIRRKFLSMLEDPSWVGTQRMLAFCVGLSLQRSLER